MKLFLGGPPEDDGIIRRQPLVTAYVGDTRYRINYVRLAGVGLERYTCTVPTQFSYKSELCANDPVSTPMPPRLLFVGGGEL